MVGKRSKKIIKKKVVGHKLHPKLSLKLRPAPQLHSVVLFSGGKDSCLALDYALRYTTVKCLIIMQSKNDESYMFHTPNIEWAKNQAENIQKATGIPYIVQITDGEKEKELADLESVIKKIKKKYQVQAIVTGAIESVYQASRVQTITNNLGMECFNPLWQKDQIELLEELIEKKFDVIIIGTFGYGLDKLIGRKIDYKFIEEIRLLKDRLKINPAGEGGEYESFVLNAPYYKKPLKIIKSNIVKDSSGGIVMHIERLE
jgi:ABC transporter with metal-binding/Fe-S-binding domain ATP-binding protein